jgi:hypothetical protein
MFMQVFSYTPYAVPAQQFGVHKVSVLSRDGLPDVANLCLPPAPSSITTLRIQPLCFCRYIGMRWGSAADGRKDHDLQCAALLRM